MLHFQNNAVIVSICTEGDSGGYIEGGKSCERWLTGFAFMTPLRRGMSDILFSLSNFQTRKDARGYRQGSHLAYLYPEHKGATIHEVAIIWHWAINIRMRPICSPQTLSGAAQ